MAPRRASRSTPRPGTALRPALPLRALALVALALGLAGLAPRALEADQGWWGDLDKGQNVRLGDVLAAPERHRGRSLTFVCVFHRAEREFNPLRTRFNAERYDNFSAWPDAAPLWLQKDFESDFPFLYVARSHPQRDALLRLDMFTRIELTGRIETVLDGQPFIEITSWRATGHRLGKDVMEAMLRGETYARAGGPEAQSLAAENFRRALDLHPDLAPAYALRIRSRLAEALRGLGRADEADAVLAGVAAPGAPAPSAGPDPAFPGTTLPGEPVAPGTVVPPGFTPSMPGQPADAPPSTPLPGDPNAGRAGPPAGPPAPGPAPALEAPLGPYEGPTLPGRVVGPGEPLRPAMPSVPPLGAPPPRLPGQPEPEAPGPGASLPPGGAAPTAAPAVVDPPLPPPPPGGQAPPRRPRLAGVK